MRFVAPELRCFDAFKGELGGEFDAGAHSYHRLSFAPGIWCETLCFSLVLEICMYLRRVAREFEVRGLVGSVVPGNTRHAMVFTVAGLFVRSTGGAEPKAAALQELHAAQRVPATAPATWTRCGKARAPEVQPGLGIGQAPEIRSDGRRSSKRALRCSKNWPGCAKSIQKQSKSISFRSLRLYFIIYRTI